MCVCGGVRACAVFGWHLMPLARSLCSFHGRRHALANPLPAPRVLPCCPCRTPHPAVLFHSIAPNGAFERRSMHGSCPVIKG